MPGKPNVKGDISISSFTMHALDVASYKRLDDLPCFGQFISPLIYHDRQVTWQISGQVLYVTHYVTLPTHDHKLTTPLHSYFNHSHSGLVSSYPLTPHQGIIHFPQTGWSRQFGGVNGWITLVCDTAIRRMVWRIMVIMSTTHHHTPHHITQKRPVTPWGLLVGRITSI